VPQKYTIDLPLALYKDLRGRSDELECTTKDVVVRCLRFGLTAMEIEKDPARDLILRERVQVADSNGKPAFEYRDLIITFV
jgi:hypothetical protein